MPLARAVLVWLLLPLSPMTLFAADQTPVATNLRAELRQTIGNARDQVFPALVSISVVLVSFQGGKEVKGQATGSGTIFSKEGYVVTNAHVTAGGRKFVCTLADQREVPARLVGEDPLTDLAVLQLDREALGDFDLAVATFGDSDRLEIGDYVMAMGSPFSLARSVSLGIVSNTERVFPGGFGGEEGEMELEQGQRTGLFTRWLQHDALISPGNSGGPLVNLAGEVVGINELGAGNLSFAIPSNLARRVSAALIAEGEVVRSYLGLAFRPAESGSKVQGAAISAVELEGPADQAGILPGDVLVAIDGKEVVGRVAEDLPLVLDTIASQEVGRELTVRLLRGKQEIEKRVTTARLVEDLGEEQSFHAWGLTGQEITPKMARDLRLAGTEGVLITGARQGGPALAAEPPLAPGDVLTRVDGRAIRSLADLVALYHELDRPTPLKAAATEDQALLVEVKRRGAEQITLLSPRREADDDPPRELPKAWIGVATQPILAELGRKLGLSDQRGFRITRVYPQTEAEKAGLKVGDIVLSLDGVLLQPQSLEDGALLARQVRSRTIGDSVKLEVRRGRDQLEVTVVLERTRLSKEEARRATDSDFEVSVRELTFFDRDENLWPDTTTGVIVENVDGAGWFGQAGIQPGDLITEINQSPVSSLAAFRRALESFKTTRVERIAVKVRRGPYLFALEIQPDWSPEKEEAQ